jgi:hypothetical protein
MNNSKKEPGAILKEFFNSVQFYIQGLIEDKANLMDGLTHFVNKAWEVPKKYKGHSGQMGFIPEYVVFETVRQIIAKKNAISFLPVIRTKTFKGLEETYYFVDSEENPRHVICQGLRVYGIKSTPLDLPRLNCAHDIVYLIKNKDWRVRAIFEVKGFFETPSLEKDMERLKQAEESYPLAENCAFVFVGFKRQDWLTAKERELFRDFTRDKNHFCVLPGNINHELGNSYLEQILSTIC